MPEYSVEDSKEFLSTLSLRRATLLCRVLFAPCLISIHALLAESDHPGRGSIPVQSDFYPRSPCGERLIYTDTFADLPKISIHALLAESDPGRVAGGSLDENFYPRSPCGERLYVPKPAAFAAGISIHALLAESDASCFFENIIVFFISIHALLAESDGRPRVGARKRPKFLSTLSLRRATTITG